jgi:hypothetical protein
MALHLLSGIRLLDDTQVEDRTLLLERSLELIVRAREIDSTLWVAWYLGGVVQRKLRRPAQLYLSDFSRAFTGQSKKKSVLALYKLHSLRLKLMVLEGCKDWNMLAQFSFRFHIQNQVLHGNAEDEEEMRRIIFNDAMDGIQERVCDEIAHKVHYCVGRVVLQIGGEHVEFVKGNVMKLLSNSSSSSNNNNNVINSNVDNNENENSTVNSNIQKNRFNVSNSTTSMSISSNIYELEGYGLPEKQVIQQRTRQMKSLLWEMVPITQDLSAVLLLLNRGISSGCVLSDSNRSVALNCVRQRVVHTDESLEVLSKMFFVPMVKKKSSSFVLMFIQLITKIVQGKRFFFVLLSFQTT